MALVFHEVRSTQARTLGKKRRDATNLSLNGFAARLGRMRGEDRVELQAIEQLSRTRHSGFFHQLMIGNGEFIAGVDIHVGAHALLALMQRFDAIVFLGKICQVEEGGKGAHNNLRALYRQRVEQLHRGTESTAAIACGQRDALTINGFVRGGTTRIALVGGNDIGKQLVE